MRKGSPCTLLVVICLLHSAFVFAAAPFNTRAESKKSLGPDSENALEKLADDGFAGKKEQLTRQLEWVLELAEELKITAEERRRS